MARKYISYFDGTDPLIIFLRGVWTMAQDFMKTISAMRQAAVGNCRKRIEDAARKAKGMIGDETPEGDQGKTCGQPQYGVTSVLKRKHGL
ncbi:hypothetical protein [Methanoregula sp.]|uniref:hypothetical protein n=1 Tax=Methanoregula sp. TaxID=2052170 RepID=UPI00356641EC